MERGKIRILAAEDSAASQLVLKTLLAKPIDISVLFATIEQTLDEAEARRAAAKTVSRDAA